jgi:hypothetical protein
MATAVLDRPIPTVLQLKNEIMEMLAHINNEQELTQINNLLHDFVENEENYSSILTPEQEAELAEGITQSYDESLLISNDEVKKMTREWLKR